MSKPSSRGAMLAGVLVCMLSACAWSDEEPALPEGLSPGPASSGTTKSAPSGPGAGEPALPEGLGGATETKPAGPGEPSLPEGLSGTEQPKPAEAEKKEPAQSGQKGAPEVGKLVSGFLDMRAGVWTRDNPTQRDASLGETRLQLELAKQWEKFGFNITADMLADGVATHQKVHLDDGRGWLDLREANVSWTPVEFIDLKIGRQILTWGTGDLLFINDLFPKDYNSFFIGRDDEYLKAPSDAIKASFFAGVANLDVVYTPAFNPDRFVDGRRVSYYSPFAGGIVGRNAIVEPERPNQWFHDDEVAARLYKNLGGLELAAYGYSGYWKDPVGMNPATMKATFPKLSVYGVSARSTVGKGIGNFEAGYYDSRDDRSGNNPNVPNSQWRLLAGYEQDLAPNFTAGLQYYVELMEDYDGYKRGVPPGFPVEDRARQVVTVRLTRQLMNQNLTLSFFAFYSPTDNDAYLRPSVHYKINDNWSAVVGGNVFLGESKTSFFGQFQEDCNVYAGLRYSF